MIRTAGAALFVFGLMAAGAAAQPLDKIEAGKKVYAAQKCQTCHSIQGVGNKRGALDDVGARLGEEELRSWIVSAPEMMTKTKATRKPVMKAYALSKDDLDTLVAYLQSLKAKS